MTSDDEMGDSEGTMPKIATVTEGGTCNDLSIDGWDLNAVAEIAKVGENETTTKYLDDLIGRADRAGDACINKRIADLRSRR